MENLHNSENMQSKNNLYYKFKLGIYNGISFELVVPSKCNKSKKHRYYIYYYDKVACQYAKGVKSLYLNYLQGPNTSPRDSKEKLEDLSELFKNVIETKILPKLGIAEENIKISLNTKVIRIVELFNQYQENRKIRKELQTIDTYRYKGNRLLAYFQLEKNKDLLLKDLNKNVWVNYRDFLLMYKIENSTVNSFIVFVRQLYGWLLENEIPIINHAKQLKPLNIAQQDETYNVIDSQTLKQLFLTFKNNKERYTRVYLAFLLIYENLLRPVQVCNIRVRDIDLEKKMVSAINNNKNQSKRNIEVSDNVIELIKLIYENTRKSDVTITPELYLLGGHNQLKNGLPNGPKSIREAFKIFTREFPVFAGIKPYEAKVTSITSQFEESEIPVDEIRRRAGHSKLETTQIYNKAKNITKPYKLKL